MNCLTTLEFCRLHERPELYTYAASLLDTAWPRSYTARLVTFERSKDTLPCVYVYVRRYNEGTCEDSTRAASNELTSIENQPADRDTNVDAKLADIERLPQTESLVDEPNTNEAQTEEKNVHAPSTCTESEESGSATGKVLALAQVCFPHKPGQVVIQSVIVHPTLRGKGVGAALLGAVERDIHERNGVTRVHLSTTDKVWFYKRCGYKVVGLRMCMCMSECACSCEGELKDSCVVKGLTADQTPTLTSFGGNNPVTNVLCNSISGMKMSETNKHIASGTDNPIGTDKSPRFPPPPPTPPPPPPSVVAIKPNPDSTYITQTWMCKSLQDESEQTLCK
ncbi:hypothetical protein SARC_13594 [Sphaeroforma arctica JP610]|uniref:N-acetyltransferase domain-containing protein n=1 Tax=Sphaeroforma arctica JP610 TaxID=667725 RepID=A0A0L0FCQ6_9EUKA|nr:hypothetical protein SARC_13594 [Sphaeroforma arctica JP610]KNC73848.1 hypothetical protein SARC_13594 [Sphaeroforma arctica JP610]|eukprot:XP_014147750.1 hypothetical protein SARC_13594 [Sphaeroforma arctica JP610]